MDCKVTEKMATFAAHNIVCVYIMYKLPPITKNLLIINVLCLMGTMALSKYGLDLHRIFGLHFFLSPGFRIWQPVTYMFLHDGFGHIFVNMFAVWMFGRIMEVEWGSKRFLIFYLLCGVGAAFTQELVQLIQFEVATAGVTDDLYLARILRHMPLTVGASGAVYGILLGYGMTYPDNQLFIIPIPVPIKAKWLVIGYVVIELGLGLRATAADNVAHFAHLGGMLAGFLILLYWKHKERKDNHIKFTW